MSGPPQLPMPTGSIATSNCPNGVLRTSPAMLGDTFGPQHQYNATGKGSAFLLSGGLFGEAVPEADPALVDAKVKQREEQIRSRNQEFTDPQIEEMLKEYRASILLANRPDSDVPLARRVNITVTWSGYNIQFGSDAPVPQTPRP